MGVPGISGASIRIPQRQAIIDGNIKLDDMEDALEGLGVFMD